MEKNSEIYIAGHTGLVGSAIKRVLEREGFTKILTKTHQELGLINQRQTEDFFSREKPKYVFLAAAKVGGIKANIISPAEFIYDNIQIQTNVINFSHKYKVKKLLFLGSSCIYPKESPQPIKEEYLGTGLCEPTNEAFAIAKISGIKMCEFYNKQYGCNFISVIPTNMYGIGDNFNPETSHLISGLITKFHEAKINNKLEIILWGTGNPRREFMYSEDAAEAFLFLMEHYSSSEIINVGIGEDLSVREIAEIVKGIVGYNGEILFDKSKPDGIYRKLLDVSKINSLGWHAKTSLKEGIRKTYEWFKENKLTSRLGKDIHEK